MSCNDCRVLRKGCSESCILRTCLQWIPSPDAQANATLFLARFFGRSDLMALVSAVPQHQRPALFQSLLFEACGRTVNPVNGAVGLLSSGNWHVCQTAVQTVLAGGELRRLPGAVLAPSGDDTTGAFSKQNLITLANQPFLFRDIGQMQGQPSVSMSSGAGKMSSGSRGGRGARRRETVSFSSEEFEMTSGGSVDRKLLNLFV